MHLLTVEPGEYRLEPLTGLAERSTRDLQRICSHLGILLLFLSDTQERRQKEPTPLVITPCQLPVTSAFSLPSKALRPKIKAEEHPNMRQVWDLWSPPIRATTDVVWATVADILRYPEYMPIVAGIYPVTNGPIKIGYRYKQATWLLTSFIEGEAEVVEFQPPHRFSIRNLSDHSLCQYIVVHDGQAARIRSIRSQPAAISPLFLSYYSLFQWIEGWYLRKLKRVAEMESRNR